MSLQNDVKKLSEAQTYTDNPFVEGMLTEVQSVKKNQFLRSSDRKSVQMIVNDSGEVTGHSVFMRTIEVDEDQFTKLYISQLAALWELPRQSLRVIGYILKNLRPNDDKIYFDMEECMKYCDYKTDVSVFQGLLGLVKAKIIARSNKSYMYYINPLIVFNGSRVTFATTYRKKNSLDPNQTRLELGNGE